MQKQPLNPRFMDSEVHVTWDPEDDASRPPLYPRSFDHVPAEQRKAAEHMTRTLEQSDTASS